MRFGRRLLDKPAIQHLSKKRSTLVWVAQDHVDHLVITCITERLLHDAESERRAQHERMNQPLDVRLVPRPILFSDGSSDQLESFEQRIEAGEHGLTNLLRQSAFHLQSIHAW